MPTRRLGNASEVCFFPGETLVRVGGGAGVDLRRVQGHRFAAGLGGLGLDQFEAVFFLVAEVDPREHFAAAWLEDGVVKAGSAVDAGVAVEVAMQLGVAGQWGFGHWLQGGKRAVTGKPPADADQGTVKRKTEHGRLRWNIDTSTLGVPRRRRMIMDRNTNA